MSERYAVISVTGRGIVGHGGSGGGRAGTSYSVIDTAYNCREVFSRYVEHNRGGGGERRRAQAERECDRLNAIEASRP